MLYSSSELVCIKALRVHTYSVTDVTLAIVLQLENAQQYRALMMILQSHSVYMMLSQCPVSRGSEISQVLSPVLFQQSLYQSLGPGPPPLCSGWVRRRPDYMLGSTTLLLGSGTWLLSIGTACNLLLHNVRWAVWLPLLLVGETTCSGCYI